MNLADKYRPRTFADVVGQDKVVNRLKGLAARGSLAGRAYWLSGQSGTGKTTIARLIAQEVADEFNVEEMDAGEFTADTLRRIKSEMRSYGLGAKIGRAYIVNEAHGLNAVQVRNLLTVIEPGDLPDHVVFIFTTTVEGQAALFEGCDDASPLLSRCIRLDLARRDLRDAFAVRAREIAQAEGLDGQPIERYQRLVKESNNNFRAVLQAIDSGAMMD